MGLLSEPRITRIAQMGYDAPRPFVLGFWVPACAGMTWECAGMMVGVLSEPRVAEMARMG